MYPNETNDSVAAQIAAERQCKEQQGAMLGGSTLGMAGTNAAPGLRDRVRNRLQGSRQEVQRCEELAELHYLLEKNPDVARILELKEILELKDRLGL